MNRYVSVYLELRAGDSQRLRHRSLLHHFVGEAFAALKGIPNLVLADGRLPKAIIYEPLGFRPPGGHYLELVVEVRHGAELLKEMAVLDACRERLREELQGMADRPWQLGRPWATIAIDPWLLAQQAGRP